MKHRYTFLKSIVFTLLFFFSFLNIQAQVITLSSDATVTEDGSSATITATSDVAPTAGEDVTVTIAVKVGSTTATGGGTDYTLASTTITISADGTNKIGTTSLASITDILFEGDEIITFEITGVSDNGDGSGGVEGPFVEHGTPQETTVTITDDETISISRDNSTIAEDGSSTVTYTATASGGAGTLALGDVTVTMDFTTGTATSGTDFTGAGNITVSDGSGTGTVVLTSATDVLFEGNETIIGAGTPSYGSMGTASATTTITDDETISISRNNATIAEDGSSTVTYTATVSGGGTADNGNVTVITDFTGGTATSGMDFTGAGDITITDGTASGTVVLTSATDNFFEGDETITGEISNPSYGLIGTASATTTITDDETISISRDNASIAEDGSSTVTYSATVSGGGTADNGDVLVTMDFTTGTATSGTDFTGAGNITVTDGTASGTVVLTSATDVFIELDETIIGTGTPSYGSMGTASATTTITDNELVLLTPSDGATGEALDVSLTWSSVLGADQYKLYVNTQSNFLGTAIINGVDQGDVQTDTPGGLTDNTTYYWKVVPRNIASSDTRTESDVEVRSFTTTQQSVTGISPATGSTAIAINPTLSWPAATGADKYRLEVNTDAGFGGGTIVYDNSTIVTNSQALSGLLNNKTYYWRVTAQSNLNGAAIGPNGVTSSSTSTFTTVLATPVQATPANSSSQTYIDPVTFIWTHASSYTNVDFTVTVATDNGFGNIVGTSTVSNVLTTTVSLPQAGDYYWKIDAEVTSGANIGETKTSGTTIFTLTLPGPILTAPVNGLTGVSVEPVFTWASVTGAVSYRIYLDDANDFATPIYSTDQGTNLTKSFFEIETEMINGGVIPLDNNTMYYWKVAAVDNVGDEYDSQIYHFTTIPNVPVTHTLPLNGTTVNMTDVTFYWYIIGSQGGMKFKIQVEEYAGHVPTAAEWDDVLAVDFEATTTNTNKLFTLLEGKTYYWRIIVLTAGDEVINYSDTWSFTTGGGTTVTPYQSWPIGGVTLLTNTPTLYWYLATYAPGVTYQVKYSTAGTIGGLPDPLELNAGDFYPTNANIIANGSSNLYLTLPTLSPGISYYWQVRVYYPATAEFGPWSGVESFVTYGSGTLVKPIASYPLGGVTVYTTAPTLYWYTGTAGTGLTYDIDIELVSAGLDGVVNYQNVTGLYKQVTGLTPGATYVWSVRSDNGTSESAWSDPATFTVVGGVNNGYPVITWPVGNPTMYTTKPTINWFIQGSSLGLTDVVLRYKEGSNSNDWDNVYDGTISIPLPALLYTFTFDLNEGSTYYFALAATDGFTFSAWDEDAFTVYSALFNISDPVLTTPIGGINLVSKSPTLYWYVIGDHTAIQSYEVTYSTSDVFAGGSPTTIIATPTTPYLALSNLTPGATYYWKVRSFYTNATYSNYSVTETFRIDPGSSAIQPIVGGPNNVVINTTSPTISWVLPVEQSSMLMSEIIIADNPDMINAITIDNIEESYFDISDLESGKSYFWRVRTKTAENSYSEYSGQGIFKVGDNVTAIEEAQIIPDKFEVSQNYPNPFNPSTMIKYGIPESQFVTLKIYNMLGQEVTTLVNNEVEAGVHNISWNGLDDSGSKVSTGTYIYRVVAGNSILTKKMILLK